ncbi:hypothetical protein, partial [Pseudomonas lurida]|uniref:hypothetical protein n=1 Tax=Pseudomonas lurida TaxID=244566 RepID=UPI0034D97BB5
EQGKQHCMINIHGSEQVTKTEKIRIPWGENIKDERSNNQTPHKKANFAPSSPTGHAHMPCL